MKTYKALLPHAEEVLEYLAERYRLYVVPNGFTAVQKSRLWLSCIDRAALGTDGT